MHMTIKQSSMCSGESFIINMKIYTLGSALANLFSVFVVHQKAETSLSLKDSSSEDFLLREKLRFNLVKQQTWPLAFQTDGLSFNDCFSKKAVKNLKQFKSCRWRHLWQNNYKRWNESGTTPSNIHSEKNKYTGSSPPEEDTWDVDWISGTVLIG